MGLRLWLGRVVAGVWKLLVQFGALAVGQPLPGVHYPDPDAEPAPAPDPDRAVREARPPGAAHMPPAWHPERQCTTPPTRIERELWAALGIDVKRTGG